MTHNDRGKAVALWAGAMLALSVAGCVGGGASSGDDAGALPASLAGTSWRLVEVQSMDDAIGTTRPDDPAKYTMTLGADGQVAMVLDCNQAMGTWSAMPASDAASGSFTFGPLAMTLALCSASSLDQQIARDAPYVAGYLIRDGQLALSLMADGGIYLWEPML